MRRRRKLGRRAHHHPVLRFSMDPLPSLVTDTWKGHGREEEEEEEEEETSVPIVTCFHNASGLEYDVATSSLKFFQS